MISGIYKSKLQAKEAVERHGAAAFVEKPFKLGALFDKLKGVLGERYPPSPSPSPSTARPSRPVRPAGRPAGRGRGGAGRVHPPSPLAGSGRPCPARRRRTGGLPDARRFAEVLADAAPPGATGALLLRRDKVKKIVYLPPGRAGEREEQPAQRSAWAG